MEQYKNLVREIQNNGVSKGDRTGTGTKSIFGHQMRFDLEKGFPLVTVKKTHWPSVVHELLWFLNGDTNTKYLQDNGVRIWNEWADDNGNLGPVYGKQWVNWGGTETVTLSSKKDDKGFYQWDTTRKEGINQIQNVIDTLKTNPNSRRMIVSAWNVGELGDMALEPCHAFFQFYTSPMTPWERASWVKENGLVGDFVNGTGVRNCIDGYNHGDDILEEMDERGVPTHKLSLQLYQRSADTFLGVPFNIASYSLLLQMMSQCVNMVPSEFIWTGGDCHLYDNHSEQVDILLNRTPKKLPSVKLNPDIKDIFEFKFGDIELVDYDPHPLIRGKVAV
jgi:thymidylate synthase